VDFPSTCSKIILAFSCKLQKLYIFTNKIKTKLYLSLYLPYYADACIELAVPIYFFILLQLSFVCSPVCCPHMQGMPVSVAKSPKRSIHGIWSFQSCPSTAVTLSIYSRNGKKRPKITKKTEKNSIIKPLSTISVPCMKIHGGPRPPAPRCWRPWSCPVHLCFVQWCHLSSCVHLQLRHCGKATIIAALLINKSLWFDHLILLGLFLF